MRIYLITNCVNSKQYVGQTVQSLQKRWARHCWCSTRKSNMPISLAIAKYGVASFEMVELAVCNTQAELDAAEVHWVNVLDTWAPHGYNLRAGNGPGTMSAITRARISAALRGRKQTPEHRQRLVVAHTGLVLGEEAKKKLRAFYQGRSVSVLGPAAAALVLAKTYTLLSPEGVTLEVVNMREHCHIHGLSRFKMSDVVNGKRVQHKGWRLP